MEAQMFVASFVNTDHFSLIDDETASGSLMG
jgi:hypothetical protein